MHFWSQALINQTLKPHQDPTLDGSNTGFPFSARKFSVGPQLTVEYPSFKWCRKPYPRFLGIVIDFWANSEILYIYGFSEQILGYFRLWIYLRSSVGFKKFCWIDCFQKRPFKLLNDPFYTFQPNIGIHELKIHK